MKKGFIILITIITILLILTYSFQAIAAPNYASWNKYYQEHNSNSSSVIIGQDGVAYNLNSSNKVVINQYVDVGHSDGSMFISILNQPNVWCAEHGTNIGMKREYNVASWTAVSDPVLAYILASRDCDTDDDGKMDLQKHETDASQIALWYYLNKSEHADRNKIVAGGIATNEPKTTDKGYVKDVWEDGLGIYNEAKSYNSTPSITITNSKLEGEYIKFNLSGNYDSFKIYLNDSEVTYTKESTGRISIKIDPNTISEVNIKAIGYKKVYTAGYYLLKSNEDKYQRLMVVTTGTTNKSATSTTKINISTDISLQKYIVGVSNTTGNAGTDTLGTARRNKYAVSEDKTLYQDVDSYNHKDHNISNFSGEKTVSTSNISGYNKSIKREAPVKIEAGDKVTYRITVYNNSNVDATNVKVYDDGYPSQGTITEMKAKKGGGSYSSATSLSSAGVTATDTSSGKKVFTFALAKNTKMDIYITIRYEYYSDSLVRNRAYIYETTPTNKKDNRTIDGDYIEMEKYSVSLEKYVTYDCDVDGSGDISAVDARLIRQYVGGQSTLTDEQKVKADVNRDGEITEEDAKVLLEKVSGLGQDVREGHRYNENASTSENKDTYKPNNKVAVEPGDTVLFTIKLTNTGTNPVKITQIYDSFKFIESGTSNGLKLVYDEEYGIQGNGNGIIENYHYGSDDKDNANKNLDRYLIKFNNATLLNGSESVYVTMRFRVEVPYELTDKEQSLWNVAAIVELQNSNNIPVSDSDGTDNNRDADYLKTKTYSVSLEKYVSAINGNNLSYNENYDINNDGIVDAMDSRTILGYTSGNIEFDANQIKKADIDGNGEVEALDARKILQSLKREEHPTYEDTNKENDPVPLEVGDEITYTIKLENTGDTTIKVTEIEDTFDDNNNANIVYVDGSISGYGNSFDVVKEDGKLKITLQNPEEIPSGEFRYLTLKFIVEVPVENTATEQLLKNTAEVKTIINRNDVIVLDSDGEENNIDSDWVKTKIYAVSLEKYVSKVVTPDEVVTKYDDREGKAQHGYDNDSEAENKDKFNNPVTVKNGDEVTYTIKVTNDGDTDVTITNIADYLPNGVKDYKGDEYCNAFEHKASTSYNGNGEVITIDENGQIINNKISVTSEEIKLEPKTSSYFEIEVTVTEPEVSLNLLKNVAEIISMENKNNKTVLDTTGNNNKDADYIQLDYEPEPVEETIDYTVEKKWDDNNNEEGKRPNGIKVQLYRNNVTFSTVVNLKESNNWKYTWKNLPKYDTNGNEYVYTVQELEVPSGYNVSYENSGNMTTIINSYEKPDPETISKTVVKEWLDEENSAGKRPESISIVLCRNNMKSGTVTLNSSNNWKHTWENLPKYDNNGNEYVYTVQEVEVPAGYKVTYDQTENEFIVYNTYEDGDDSPDVIIGGYVWNDKSADKEQKIYDGIMGDEEKKLEGIKVYLYRVGIDEAVAIKYTNSEGHYSFANTDLDSKVIEKECERYIKAPKNSNNDRWNDKRNYYSYYVVFEYDGITYTSTPDGTTYKDIIMSEDYKGDSNAAEDNSKGKTGVISRTTFNNSFNPVNNTSGITYTTTNEDGYIPQSIHSSTKVMQSSTNLIEFKKLLSGLSYSNEKHLEKIKLREDKLKNVGLGLRGKDIFDLELTSDVHNIKVTVNDVEGDYEYFNTNKVTLRKSDLTSESTSSEDMANLEKEISNTYIDAEGHKQLIRETDLDVSKTGSNYGTNQGIQNILVTYKITVHNTSPTAGIATKIINYYDSAYKSYTVTAGSNCSISNVEGGTTDDGHKYVMVTTSGEKMLNQAETMDIYITYSLGDPDEIKTTLGNLNNPLPTYNMAEIAEYKTGCGNGQTEYTRGLIDKDSAPGSANEEKVRLHPDQIGLETTVNYYFNGNDELSLLKYEDDTYATPTLYFVKDSSKRKIEGIVFEDKTGVDKDTNIKTGNGVYEEGEAKVFGATVELVEITTSNDPNEIGKDEGTVRYTATTKKDGTFTFEGYLPGNYVIRYWYGDSKETVLLKQADDGSVNNKSYNGEDFHATNNKYAMTITEESGNTITAKTLNSSSNDWYAFNEDEKVSTGFDNSERRTTVSQNLTKDDTEENVAKTIELQKQLNKARDGENIDAGSKDNNGSLIEQTYMYATTQTMLLTVEETVKVNDSETKQNTEFGDYTISAMNFGIAEVPVTTIDLQKEINAFTITDSTGANIIASIEKDEDGNLDYKTGDIIAVDGMSSLDVSIEDEKLQGARLQVTYNITSNMDVELNYDNSTGVKATITEFVDVIDNNLSYNPNLGSNSTYWEVMTTEIERSSIENIANYSTIVKATSETLSKINSGVVVPITLEKVLSSTNSTIDEIITSAVTIYEYNNTVEITELSYDNVIPEGTPEGTPTSQPLKDRIRTADRYIIIPGVHHDSASAEEIVIHPPTGDSSISMVYYVIAVIGLTVLAIGVFGIKKFVVKK